MVGETGNILTSALDLQVLASQRTAKAIDASQLRLATGQRVNSALDNPNNFFTSLSLSQDATDLGRVLDGLSQGIRSLQAAENALLGLNEIIGSVDSITRDAQRVLVGNTRNVSDLILADDPVLYYKLDESTGTAAANLGTGGSFLDGGYRNGVAQNAGALHFGEGNNSAKFDGVNDYISIRNHPLINTSAAGYAERTVELTFQADDVNGRQVLFEEGGTGNSAAIYLDDNRIYFAARDAGDFGPFDISTTIEAGKTYHASFVLDSNAGTFTGYLNGEEVGTGDVTKPLARHTGGVAIGRNINGTHFHDGANPGNGESFQGRISDFALYNSVLTQEDLESRYEATQLDTAELYEKEVSTFLEQIDPFVNDSGFRGVNLLDNDFLRTNFNVTGSSKLITEGGDFRLSSLGLNSPSFRTLEGLNETLDEVERALKQFETFSNKLANSLSIIQARQNFTEQSSNILQSASSDLVVGNQEEEAANLLALQTRQQVQVATLALSNQGTNIGDLLFRQSTQ